MLNRIRRPLQTFALSVIAAWPSILDLLIPLTVIRAHTYSHMSKQWLDELLPPNAHEICRGKVTVVVTTLPDLKQVGEAALWMCFGCGLMAVASNLFMTPIALK